MELFLAPVKLSISGTEAIRFVPEISLHYQNPIIDTHLAFNCHYQSVEYINQEGWIPVFSGESFEETIIPYKWQILQRDESVKIDISYFDHTELTAASAILNLADKEILIQLVSKHRNIIQIDPLFHPLGSLLLVYLAHFSGGMLIHASGIKDNDQGYLFTGLSGIGKSTMSRLWKDKGATVINDDRLWIHQLNGKWHIFNTPMIFYAQKPLMSPLSKAFLLRQSPNNECNQITGIQSAMRFMSNCIQHFYNKEMTTAHLDRIVDLTSKVPLYDLGFKPDTEIVDLIRQIRN